LTLHKTKLNQESSQAKFKYRNKAIRITRPLLPHLILVPPPNNRKSKKERTSNRNHKNRNNLKKEEHRLPFLQQRTTKTKTNLNQTHPNHMGRDLILHLPIAAVLRPLFAAAVQEEDDCDCYKEI
jgi:hypothetical protein